MQAVILAGGSQSTIHPEREEIPKPMIEIGERPLLWHIMKSFSAYGIKDFIVCGGYKVEMIKEYFLDFYIYASDITVDLSANQVEIHKNQTEDWNVTVVNTGKNTSALGRIHLIKDYVKDDFFVTYGDCLSDIDLHAMDRTHRSSGRTATIAMVKPTGRKQFLSFDADGGLSYSRLGSDSHGAYGWINGNLYLFQLKIFSMIKEHLMSEEQLFSILSKSHNLEPYYHSGFWTSIETLRDHVAAEKLWEAGIAPWNPEEKSAQ